MRRKNLALLSPGDERLPLQGNAVVSKTIRSGGTAVETLEFLTLTTSEIPDIFIYFGDGRTTITRYCRWGRNRVLWRSRRTGVVQRVRGDVKIWPLFLHVQVLCWADNFPNCWSSRTSHRHVFNIARYLAAETTNASGALCFVRLWNWSAFVVREKEHGLPIDHVRFGISGSFREEWKARNGDGVNICNLSNRMVRCVYDS